MPVDSTVQQRTALALKLADALEQLPPSHALGVAGGVLIDLMKRHGFDKGKALMAFVKMWEVTS